MFVSLCPANQVLKLPKGLLKTPLTERCRTVGMGVEVQDNHLSVLNGKGDMKSA